METSIFVITHKDINDDFPPVYKLLLVGAKTYLGSNIYSYRDDMTLDNISDMNKYYCELSGVYYVWKNGVNDVDKIGFTHYRRFFVLDKLYMRKTRLLPETEITKILQQYKIILPKKLYLKKTIEESANIAPNKDDLVEIRKAIQNVCEEYLTDYDWYLSQKGTYLLNMFITNGKIFNDYCEWLFPILGYLEKQYNLLTMQGCKERFLGFFGERLLNVWVHHNIINDDIYELNVFNNEKSWLRQNISIGMNYFRRLLYM